MVRTAPDIATLTYVVRGEGVTSDDAVRALVATRDAIDAALVGRAQVRTGRLSVQAARDRACDVADDDESPRLSTGACAVRGYVATIAVTAMVASPVEAGTLLGLASRLGATDPALETFALRDPAAARRAATTDAVRDARDQAAVIAAASHVTLGALRRVEDQRATDGGGEDVVVTGARRQLPAATAPILINVSPAPIETSATLVVEFDVGAAVR